MRFRPRTSRRRLERIALNLASMIDVTFLLLIYFMVTMVIAEEDQLQPTLKTQRESLSGEANDFQPQIIDVLDEGGRPIYRLSGRRLEDRSALAGAVGSLPKSVGVFINVHDGVPVGFAAAALQTVRDAGFEKVTYVAAE